MCLLVPKDGKIEKARKDIKVYKSVIDDGVCWRSPYFFTRFDYNKVETAMDGESPIEHLYIDCEMLEHWLLSDLKGSEFLPNLKNSKGCIHEGFHSMLKKDDVVFGEVTDLRTCIIPKGSEYCIGMDGDVVSVKLIVFKTWFDYVVFRLKSIWRDMIGRVEGI
jgi:hypothetical protein